MTPTLRPFQRDLKGAVHQAWNQGARNVVMQLATGGGKTVTLSDITREVQDGYVCIIAHRTELVGQLSLTLAKYDVRHNVISSDSTRRGISRMHVEELGRSWVDSNARVVVASIDTLVRHDASEWAHRVTLWVVDEGHHLVLDNKWHRGIANFTHPSVRGLLPTATPVRADNKGLGRPELGGHGVADVMVRGPEMRWLIDEGYLCDYRIVCPKSDMTMLRDVSASGDWSTQALREAAKRSHIVGDVVQAYLKWGQGKLGVTFATDVETATEMTFAYVKAGVNAACLTGKTDDHTRRAMLKRYARREIEHIVAVDIISEGFDLPAIEYLGMARPTQSYALFAQQFGRALRVLEGKEKAIIVDHVGNVIRHEGPPDKPKRFTLSGTVGGSKADEGIPHRVCDNCLAPYERFHRTCPYCGHYPQPAVRSSPAHVEGDMEELDAATLLALRTAVDEADQSLDWWRSKYAAQGWSNMVAGAQLKNHAARIAAQPPLRVAMATWGGVQREAGMTDAQMQRAFYLKFGMSTVEAMAVYAKEAQALTERIKNALV
jgi:DNA repair protein RadD